MTLIDKEKLVFDIRDKGGFSSVFKALKEAPAVDAIPVEYIRDYATVLRNSADHLDNREEHELADMFIYGSDALNFMLMKWEQEKNKNE